YYLPIHAPLPTHLHPLSLHDALPIFPGAFGGKGPGFGAFLIIAGEGIERIDLRNPGRTSKHRPAGRDGVVVRRPLRGQVLVIIRSEEHTSELQSLAYLVCRLLLEKKK